MYIIYHILGKGTEDAWGLYLISPQSISAEIFENLLTKFLKKQDKEKQFKIKQYDFPIDRLYYYLYSDNIENLLVDFLYYSAIL